MEDSIAVVGMSCIFPGIDGLTSFWKSVANQISISQIVDEECLLEMEPAGQGGAAHILRINEGYAPQAQPDTAEPEISPDYFSNSDRLQALTATQAASALLDAGIELSDQALSRVHFTIVHNPEWKKSSTTHISAETIESPGASQGRLHNRPPNLDSPLAILGNQDLASLADAEIFKGNEACVFEALQQGMSYLKSNACDLFVLVAINLFPSGKNAFSEEDSQRHRSKISFENDTQSAFGRLPKTEGVAAIVLSRSEGFDGYLGESYATIKNTKIQKNNNAERLSASDTDPLTILQERSRSDLSSWAVGFLELQGRTLGENLLRDLGPIKTSLAYNGATKLACPVESVKSIVGEAGTASALASLIKAALCLNNKIIPGDPAPLFPRSGLLQEPFYANVETRPWIHPKCYPPRRAAVTIVGHGGTNAYTLLEETTEQQNTVRSRPISLDLKRETELIVFSADSINEIKQCVKHLQSFLVQRGSDIHLGDIARTQNEIFSLDKPYRLAIVCRDIRQLGELLGKCSARLEIEAPQFDDLQEIYFGAPSLSKPGKLAFLYPGLGLPGLNEAQLETMKELCLHFPEVRDILDVVDRRGDDADNSIPTSRIFFPPTYLTSLEREELLKRLSPPVADENGTDDLSHGNHIPSFAVAVVNHANYNLLKALKVPADMMYGLSVGELNALCCAGSLSFDAVIPLFWKTLVDDRRLANSGRLAFAVCSEGKLESILDKVQNVGIAFHIAHELQILGGQTSQLEKALDLLREKGIWTQSLPYPAIHTPFFTDLKTESLQLLEQINIELPTIAVYAGRDGQLYPNDINEIRKTLLATFDRPIMFWQTIENMYRDGARIFLQVGLGNNLHTQAKAIIKKEGILSLSLHSDHHSAITQLNHLCAQLIAADVSLDLSLLFKYRHTQKLKYDLRANGENPLTANVTDSLGLDHPENMQQKDEISETREATSSRLRGGDKDMPFLGEILSFSPRQEITFRYQLDIKEDLYLGDHIFVHAPVKPLSECAPVLPLTFGMEIMAEAAACLAPGYGLVGFERLKAYKWIDLKDSETHSLTVTAQFVDEDPNLLIRRIKVDILKEGETTPAKSCVVVYGKRYLLSLQLRFEEMEGFHLFSMKPDQIYEERHLFHGPLLRCITKIEGVGERNIVGEITMPASSGMFRSLANPEFVFAPAVFDAVAQLLGVWSMEKSFRALPIGIEKLELYRPAPSPGVRLPVSIQITGISQRILHADIEIQDGAGGVWGRIKKWSFWIFHWPQRAIDFLRMPYGNFLSSETLLPFIPNGAICRQVSEADIYDLDLTLIARICLHSTEMSRFFELERNPRRQRQWLLGRVAAKDAILDFLQREDPSMRLHPAEIRLRYDGSGRPVPEGPENRTKSLQISISHAEDRAVAVAHREPVGIDLELIRERNAGFLESFTNAEERSMLSRFDPNEKPALITRLWCAKEAAAKMRGTKMGSNPHAFQAARIQKDGKIILDHHQDNLKFSVNTHQDDEFILAVATVLR